MFWLPRQEDNLGFVLLTNADHHTFATGVVPKTYGKLLEEISSKLVEILTATEC